MFFENLDSYYDIVVRPMVEESDDEIYVAIRYNDHGDDFVYIKTKDGKQYTYGYFLNRRGYPDDNQILDNPERYENDPSFIRLPKVYKRSDSHQTENGLLRMLHSWVIKYDTHRPIIWQSKMTAQRYLKAVNEEFDDAYKSGYRYELSSYRSDISNWLVANNIISEANISMLNDMKLSSKVDGADGEAGKIKSDGIITFDMLSFVIVNDKMIDIRDVEMESLDEDEWGFSSYQMDTYQFDQFRIPI